MLRHAAWGGCRRGAPQGMGVRSGSSFGGSCLKLGWVGVGLRMEFHAEDQWIITSHVRSIAVEHAAQNQPF